MAYVFFEWFPFFSVAPKINLQDNYYVDREQAVSLLCRVEGYPPPAITWTPCNRQERVCDKSFLNIQMCRWALNIPVQLRTVKTRHLQVRTLVSWHNLQYTCTCSYYMAELVHDEKERSDWFTEQTKVSYADCLDNHFIKSLLNSYSCCDILTDLANFFCT